MTTASLRVNRDIILASKRQTLAQRRDRLPPDALRALAAMQPRPPQLLSTVADRGMPLLIAQVRRSRLYDPVTTALRCVRAGADVVSLFTDHTIYDEDLDDLLMMTRALKSIPVISENYVLDPYGVLAMRAAGAAALVVYGALLEADTLREIVSLTGRMKMVPMVQAMNAGQIERSMNLSPPLILIGDNLSRDINGSLAMIDAIQPTLPSHTRVMLMHRLESVEEVAAAIQRQVPAIIVSSDLLTDARRATALRALMNKPDSNNIPR